MNDLDRIHQEQIKLREDANKLRAEWAKGTRRFGNALVMTSLVFAFGATVAVIGFTSIGWFGPTMGLVVVFSLARHNGYI